MNKNDFKIIIILLIISLVIFLLTNKQTQNKAIVYYQNKPILNIDLTVNKTIEVNGTNGIVKIVVKDNKIKVEEENSNKHLCSKQGYISKSYESIVCLPNEIIIKIANNDEIDAKVW